MKNLALHQWYVVVNPVSGTNRGSLDWPQIRSLLESHLIDFDFAFTQRKYHAVELTVSAIRKGYRRIICVGGDGTHNEIVNGIFFQDVVPTTDITLGYIGVGTGNDWARTYMLPTDYYECVKAIKGCKTFIQDVGRIDFVESRLPQQRYIANMAGIGFGAEVASTVNRFKEKGLKGKSLYLFSILKTLFTFKPSTANVRFDGLNYEGNVFNMVLGIGKYNGGGVMQAPKADPSDGLFDITFIKKVSRFSLLTNISKLYNGNILKHPQVLRYQSAEVQVSSPSNLTIEVDGESLGSSPFTFSVVPQSVRVIVGNEFSRN
ncbi:MAG TPA: diacylglycerol kinase family protein [Perlabentimonas sp.]|nr:diacylglycerol kinase family protein [Perlabentimonas sp.]